MNIVFWLIVVIVLVLVWFCLSFALETEKKTDEEKEVKE